MDVHFTQEEITDRLRQKYSVKLTPSGFSLVIHTGVYLHRNLSQKQYMFASEIDPAAAV